VVRVNTVRSDAENVANWAEKYRREKAIDWLGEEMPTWPTRCPLTVTFQQQDQGGATSFGWFNGQVYQTMQMGGPADRVINCILPHEVTHTVFAYYFGAPLPRWADEGGATLSEDEAERERHESVNYELLTSRNRFVPLSNLFGQRDYGKDPTSVYVEGYSVSAYLVSLKDRKTFLQFIRSGMENGWNHATQRYYGFQSVDQLQQQWVANCLGIFKRRQQQQPQQGQPGPLTSAPAIQTSPLLSGALGALQRIDSNMAALADAHKGLNAGQTNLQSAFEKVSADVASLKASKDDASGAIAKLGTSISGLHGKTDKLLPAIENIAGKAGPVLDGAAAIAANPATSSLLSLLGPAGIAAASVAGSLGSGWMVVRRLKPLTSAIGALGKVGSNAPPIASNTPAPSLDVAGIEQRLQQAISAGLHGQTPPVAALPQVAAPPATPKSVYVPTPSTDATKKLLQQVLDTEAQKNPGTAGQMAKLRAWFDQLESGQPIS
jgi:hypothetical protein